MNTCEDHDCVVVYTGKKCPVCLLDDEIETLRQRVEELEVERDDIKS